MLKERFKELLRELLDETKAFYGERLVSVVLFGSAARGTQRFDSDLDVLIIARRLPQGRMKRAREFDAVEQKLGPLMTSFRIEGINTRISAVIKSPKEAEAGSPLFLDMVENAKILYDREEFFKQRLAKLKRRLAALGSKRVWYGSARYWDLKPDYKPENEIEL